ncbi:MAG: hypothetical protein VB876_07905, partial [Pirellulales bacterium]
SSDILPASAVVPGEKVPGGLFSTGVCGTPLNTGAATAGCITEGGDTFRFGLIRPRRFDRHWYISCGTLIGFIDFG